MQGWRSAGHAGDTEYPQEESCRQHVFSSHHPTIIPSQDLRAYFSVGALKMDALEEAWREVNVAVTVPAWMR